MHTQLNLHDARARAGGAAPLAHFCSGTHERASGTLATAARAQAAPPTPVERTTLHTLPGAFRSAYNDSHAARITVVQQPATRPTQPPLSNEMPPDTSEGVWVCGSWEASRSPRAAHHATAAARGATPWFASLHCCKPCTRKRCPVSDDTVRLLASHRARRDRDQEALHADRQHASNPLQSVVDGPRQRDGLVRVHAQRRAQPVHGVSRKRDM